MNERAPLAVNFDWHSAVCVAESGLVPVQLTRTCGSWRLMLPHADIAAPCKGIAAPCKGWQRRPLRNPCQAPSINLYTVSSLTPCPFLCPLRSQCLKAIRASDSERNHLQCFNASQKGINAQTHSQNQLGSVAGDLLFLLLTH